MKLKTIDNYTIVNDGELWSAEYHLRMFKETVAEDRELLSGSLGKCVYDNFLLWIPVMEQAIEDYKSNKLKKENQAV